MQDPTVCDVCLRSAPLPPLSGGGPDFGVVLWALDEIQPSDTKPFSQLQWLDFFHSHGLKKGAALDGTDKDVLLYLFPLNKFIVSKANWSA